jgi:hypothetical protein
MPIRVTDLAVTPDLTRLVTAGLCFPASDTPNTQPTALLNSGGDRSRAQDVPNSILMVYNRATKQAESCVDIPLIILTCNRGARSDACFLFDADPFEWAAF